jgi:hypothetical protein
LFRRRHKKYEKKYPQMNDAQIFQHIVKYKLPSSIQGSFLMALITITRFDDYGT